MALMTLSMAAFAAGDAIVKLLSRNHTTGEMLIVAGVGGALVFGISALLARQRPFTRDILAPSVLARVAIEAVGTIGVYLALSLVPLSMMIAIMQSVPLLVTLGAAVFLAEPVGWRRWSAILVGLFGVILIIRPGAEGFAPAALFAVLGAASMALRDLLTRMVPKSATTLQLGCWGFLGLVLAGAFISLFETSTGGSNDAITVALFTALILSTALAIFAITAAMRLGDVAVVAPFRYTRLIFGLAIAMIWFAEVPDAATWIGAAIVVGSGLYSFYRETRLVSA